MRSSRQMSTNENGGGYDRSKLRYPSDVTDEEWAVIGPLIPPAKKGSNNRTLIERQIVNRLMLTSNCSSWVKS